MAIVRHFSKKDWKTFDAAAKFSDGSDPLIAEGILSSGKPFTIVVDAASFQVVYTTVTDKEIAFVLEQEYNPGQALTMINQMSERLDGCRHPRSVMETMKFREIF